MPGAATADIRPALVIYPRLDLRHGRLAHASPAASAPVALGAAGAAPGQSATPEEEARRFFQAGAGWMQVVDLDAALGEGRNQWPQLSRLLDGRLRVQFGGGVRSMTQIQQLLDLGVERVIVGTQAVRNPLWARETARIFAGRIVLALDARGRDLVVDGRREGTGRDIVAAAKDLDDAGLAAFLYTEVDGPPNPALVAELRLAAPRTPLVVGGAVALEDLEWLDAAGASGAVLGPDWVAGLADAVRRYPTPARPLIQVLRAREELEGIEPGEEE